MHRLFVDQNVRAEIAHTLREEGHETIHASEVGLETLDDDAIFRWAQAMKLTIITFDIDFAERAFWSGEPHRGVIRLRIEPQTPARVLPPLRRFLAAHPPDEVNNALVILTERKYRLRRGWGASQT